MKQNENPANPTKTLISIALAAIISLLAGFVASAGAGATAGSSDAELGAAFGRGLAAVLIVCAILYFGTLRRTSKKLKMVGFGAALVLGLIGSTFGMSL